MRKSLVRSKRGRQCTASGSRLPRNRQEFGCHCWILVLGHCWGLLLSHSVGVSCVTLLGNGCSWVAVVGLGVGSQLLARVFFCFFRGSWVCDSTGGQGLIEEYSYPPRSSSWPLYQPTQVKVFASGSIRLPTEWRRFERFVLPSW